jgi:hypothetical protein
LGAGVNEQLEQSLDMHADEAQRRIKNIRRALVKIHVELVALWHGRAWLALGYDCWDDMLDAEFRDSRIQLPREERQAAVIQMSEHMPQRAIAKGLGIGLGTVNHDLSGVQNRTPAESDDAVTGDGKVMGHDGKRYLKHPKEKRNDPDRKQRQFLINLIDNNYRHSLWPLLDTFKEEQNRALIPSLPEEKVTNLLGELEAIAKDARRLIHFIRENQR